MSKNNNKDNHHRESDSVIDDFQEEALPKAKVSALATISKIWIIPIVAALIGLWMIYFHFSNLGPLIEIKFKTGEGIVAGKTTIKIKNVKIGIVEKLELNKNLEGVIVTARINNQNKYLLTKGAEFWVVRPRIGKGGFSGLSTLLSGAYIDLSPGTNNIEQYQFDGLENEPVTPAGTPGLHLTLNSSDHSPLNEGDPILFQGIEVGRIDTVYFNFKERVIYYNAFIQSPYDKLVTTNTKFWKVDGVEVTISADGIRIQSGTLESMIFGGVTFDVPKDMPIGDVVTERDFFTIYPNRDAIYDSRFKYGLQYILLFKDSIRGLKPGAPVEFKGIKLGTVTRTDIEYPEIKNILNEETLIPVMVTIEPARLGFKDDEKVLKKVNENISALIKKGLRGGLMIGNILTGSKYIELQYEKGVESSLQKFSGHLVIPTLEGQFGQIIEKLSKVMDKFNALPIAPLLNNANDSVKQFSQTLKEFQTTSKQLNILLKQSKDENLVQSIRSTLDEFKKLASGFSAGSKTHEEIQATIYSLKQTLQQLAPLLLQLNQKPNSLIFSDGKGGDFEPTGKKP